MMCQRIGLPPISTMGLGRVSVSSVKRVPRPPARMTTFMMRRGGRPASLRQGGCRASCGKGGPGSALRPAGGPGVEIAIESGYVVPGGRLVPSRVVGHGRFRIDADPRLGEVDLLLQFDQAGEAQPGAHLLRQAEREGALALGIAAGIRPG